MKISEVTEEKIVCQIRDLQITNSWKILQNPIFNNVNEYLQTTKDSKVELFQFRRYPKLSEQYFFFRNELARKSIVQLN